MDKFNKRFDHTLLKADASHSDILKLCREAEEYGFASVCVNSCYVHFAAKKLTDSDVKVTAVAGFPLGAASTAAKTAEVKDAVENGANEIDVVINIGALKDGKYDYIRNELSFIANICHEKNAILKVILETCLLTDEEITTACILAKQSHADYVKTSTGFNIAGATVHHVKLMRRICGDDMKIKASGGIKTLKDAIELINAGADRLGCSASVTIMNEYLGKQNS